MKRLFRLEGKPFLAIEFILVHLVVKKGRAFHLNRVLFRYRSNDLWGVEQPIGIVLPVLDVVGKIIIDMTADGINIRNTV